MIPNNIKDVPKAMINGFPDEYKDRLKSHIKNRKDYDVFSTLLR